MKTDSAKRRYEVEFHFGEPDPSNRNHKVIRWEVKTNCMADTIKEVECLMMEKNLIRDNKQPTIAIVRRIGWVPKEGKQMHLNCDC
jgi:hypothetical protein